MTRSIGQVGADGSYRLGTLHLIYAYAKFGAQGPGIARYATTSSSYISSNGYDHDVEIQGWDEYECGGGVRIDCIESEETSLSQTVQRDNADAWRDSYYDDCTNAPMMVDNQVEGNVHRAAIIHEFLRDVALLESV